MTGQQPRLGHTVHLRGVRRCKDVGGRALGQLGGQLRRTSESEVDVNPWVAGFELLTDLSERRLQRGSREHHDRPGTLRRPGWRRCG